MKKILPLILLLFFSIYTSNGQIIKTPFTKEYPLLHVNQSKINNTAMVFDGKGFLWLGFSGITGSAAREGLIRIDTANGSHVFFDSILPSPKVSKIRLNGNKLWVGTPQGLVSYNLISGATQWYTESNSGIPANQINDLLFEGNTLWVATPKGLGKLRGNIWKTFLSANSLLPNDSVISLAMESDAKTIWVGTARGVAKVVNAPMRNFTLMNSALKSDKIYNVLVDKWDVVWLVTDTWEDANLDNRKYGELWYISANTVYNHMRTNLMMKYEKTYSLNVFRSYAIDHNGYLNRCFYTEEISPFPFIGVSDRDRVMFVATITKQNVECKPMPALNLPLFLYDRNSVLFDANGELWRWNRRGVSCVSLNRYAQSLNWKGFYEPTTNLDVNKINAGMICGADMFWNRFHPTYEAPKGSASSPLFASGLWMGGISNQQLHMAGQTYRQSGNDFWPGPLDTTNAFIDSSQMLQYYRIWKVNKWQVDEFKQAFQNGSVANGTYSIPADILQWPAHGAGKKSKYLAPFSDSDGDGMYNPLKGDYPKIKGDQMLYWIVNDANAVHSETGGLPLGVELHMSAYAYSCPTISDQSVDAALNYTTFYEVKVINRSRNTYSDFYLGNFTDVDLGSFTDDAIGCNPLEHYAYGYNGDNVDAEYGENPPMIAVLYLNKPLSNFMAYNNDNSADKGNPTAPQHFYNYLRSLWKDGSPLTYGGDGKGNGFAATNNVVKHFFPGNSNPSFSTPWFDSTIADKRMVVSSGPYLLKPDSALVLEYAMVYSRETNLPNGLNTSFKKNHDYCMRIKQWYQQNSFPSCGPATSITDPPHQVLLHVYPNPSENDWQIQLPKNSYISHIQVFDPIGRVQNITWEQQSQETCFISGSGLSKGWYIVQITTTNGQHFAGKLLKL